MPDPTFDRSNGWWYIRWRDHEGKRTKQPLLRDDRWKGRKAKLGKIKPPPEVVLLARKYQDMETQARHGVDVSRARSTDLADHLAAYRATYASDHPKSSALVLDRALRHFATFNEAEKLRTLEATTPAHCRRYLQWRHSQGKAHATITVEKQMLSTIWEQARLDGKIPTNPWESAKVPGKPADEKPKFWTVDEIDRIVAEIDGWLKDLVIMGLNCGGRITSLLRLRWEDVHFDRSAILLNSKTGRYEVPMSATAREVLGRRFLGKSDLVFPSPRTGKPMGSSVTYSRLKRAARRAKVPMKGSYNHILRHTFASHTLMRGHPLSTVSKWLGHASINQTMVYSHLCEHESRRMMEGFSLGVPREDQAPPDADG